MRRIREYDGTLLLVLISRREMQGQTAEPDFSQASAVTSPVKCKMDFVSWMVMLSINNPVLSEEMRYT